MNLTREQTIKALEICLRDDIESCKRCPLDKEDDCRSILRKAYYEHIEKFEPAPAGTETSPKAENTANKTQVNDTPISEICQAPEYESAQEYSNFMLGLVTNAFGKADVGTLIADKGYCSVDFKFNGRDCCLSFRMEPPNADQN